MKPKPLAWRAGLPVPGRINGMAKGLGETEMSNQGNPMNTQPQRPIYERSVSYVESVGIFAGQVLREVAAIERARKMEREARKVRARR